MIRVRHVRQPGRRARSGTGNLGGSVGLRPPSGTHRRLATRARPTSRSYGPAVRAVRPADRQPTGDRQRQPPGSRRTADFQVTPSGDYAAFTSTLPLTGYDNGPIHREVFRYDARDRRARLRVLQPDQRAGDRRGRAARQRPRPQRRRARLLQLDRRARRSRSQRRRRRLRVGARRIRLRTAAPPCANRRRMRAADLDRAPARSRSNLLGISEPAPTPTSSPGRNSSKKTRTATRSRSTTRDRWAATRSCHRNRSAKPPTSATGPAADPAAARTSRSSARLRAANVPGTRRCKCGQAS